MIEQICDLLWKEQILSVIVEGGTETLNSFINADLWDEARVFRGKGLFGKGLKAPELNGSLQETSAIGMDELKIFARDKEYHI